MRWLFWVLGGLALVVVLAIMAWLNFTPQGRLIGNSYEAPPAEVLAPTARSGAQDLSALNVDFATAQGPYGGLTELLPGLSAVAEIDGGLFRVRGVPEKAGWYSDRSGPFYYRVVSGDFLVETTVRAVKADDPQSRPEGAFNSSGLLVRDASSSTGAMRWLMYNIGQQAEFYGTEAKSTVPDTGDWHVQRLAGFTSGSTLWLTPVPAGVNGAALRICRIGAEYRFFKRLPGSEQWIEETHMAGTQKLGNGVSVATPGVVEGGVIRFIRTDIPDTVQVGLINNPGMPPNDGMGVFSGLRFARIADFAACTRD